MQEPLKDQPVSEVTPETETAQAATPDLAAQLKEQENKYLYLYAEFENYKKRAIKERSDLVKFGWESTARGLLESLDNLDRTIEHAPKAVDAAWFEGVKMVAAHFRTTLEKQGIRALDSVGKNFDPHYHEALGFEKSELPSGQIVRESAKGYMIYDRLLRPAKVIVSSGL